MCFLVPQNVGLEEACTLGVGWVSAAQALEQRLFEDVGEGGKGPEKEDAVCGDLLFLFLLEMVMMMPLLTSLSGVVADILCLTSHSSSSTAPPQIQVCIQSNKHVFSIPPHTSSR